MMSCAFEFCESIQSAAELPGHVVVSKRGRDSGRACVVVSAFDPCEDGFVAVADGRLRLLGKPKRKNITHLRFTRYRHIALHNALVSGSEVRDSMIREGLTAFGRMKEL